MSVFEKRMRWKKIFDSLEEAKGSIPLNRSIRVNVFGSMVCVAHTSEGLFGIQESCPHNGFPLVNGLCTDDNAIVCPQHRYRFDLRTGRAKSGIGDAARVYPVECRTDGVYIGMEETSFKFF